MQTITIYHNPRCTKSIQVLELLQGRGIHPVIIDYMKTPLNEEQLKLLKSHFSLEDFLRSNEPVFKTLGISLDDEKSILQAMLTNPILMQRPIIVYQDKAVIGRPPEKVLELLD